MKELVHRPGHNLRRACSRNGLPVCADGGFIPIDSNRRGCQAACVATFRMGNDGESRESLLAIVPRTALMPRFQPLAPNRKAATNPSSWLRKQRSGFFGPLGARFFRFAQTIRSHQGESFERRGVLGVVVMKSMVVPGVSQSGYGRGHIGGDINLIPAVPGTPSSASVFFELLGILLGPRSFTAVTRVRTHREQSLQPATHGLRTVAPQAPPKFRLTHSRTAVDSTK